MSDPPRWLIGQRVAWLGSGSGLPRTATARWIGRLPGMGAGWTVGIELDEALPLGGVDGKWAGRRLYNCKRSHGLFVPLASIIPESDLRTRVKQGFGETPWLKELEEEFREVRQETLKRIKDKDEGKLKNEVEKKAARNGVEKEKELVTPTDIPKEESLIEAQKEKKPLSAVNDEDEVNGVYQWYDAIDHTVGESQGPVVEHLYEEVGGKSLGRDEIVKHPQTVPRKGRRREFRRIGTSDGRGGAAMTGVGAGVPMGQVERESGRVGGLSSVEEGEGSYGTNSTQRRSGFFSFLRWFKKGKEEHTECNRDCEKEEVEKEEEFDEVLDLPASPRLPSKFGTWSSVDTLASTSSFAFVQPTDYLNRRANHVELGIEPGPDTDTYRHRLKVRERSRHLDQDLTLRRKYRLHDFEVEPTPEQRRKLLRLPGDVIEDEEEEGEDVVVPTLGKRSNSTSRKGTVSSHTSSFGRKKRRAPLPPGFDLSLPNTLEHPNKSGEKTGCGSQNSRHRRSASESRTRSGYCHVKGKRRAPPPPKSHSPAFSPTVALPEPSQGPKSHSVSVSCTPPTSPRYGSFGKRKRAPPPPVNISVREDKEVQAADGLMSSRGEGSHLSPEERRRLIANIAMLRAHADKGKISMGNTRGMVSPPGSPRTGEGHTQFVRHDYLRIEKGQLLTNVEKVNEEVMGNSASEQKATLSPRPWYKRKSVLRDSPSSAKKESLHSPTPSFFKSLEKRKPWKKKEEDEVGGLGDDEDDEDWMPEVGYRRPGGIFGATSSTEVTIKHEEEEVSGDDHSEQVKRRSQVISMLANISELDREAAAIVNEERKKEREAASAEDEKFYAEPELPPVLAAAWSGAVAIPTTQANTSSGEENQSYQPKGNAKHLISLFNSISGVSNVSVSSESKITSFVSVLREDSIEEQVSEEEAERKRSTAETVQALVLDANRARLNGRRNLGRNGGNSSGSDKIQVVAENSESYEVKNSESKSGEASGPAKEDPPQVWVCARCTLENPKWRLTCDACNMWRPSGGWQGRRGSGDSEVKNKVENLEKENPSKGKSNGSNINWESELKKYFPNQDPKKGECKTAAASKSNDTKENEMHDKSSVSTVGLKDDKSQERAAAGSSNVPGAQKKIVVPNFIGGVGGKQKTEVPKEKSVIVKTEISTEKDDKGIKADLYEVRKARLAFFSVDKCESQDRPAAIEVELGESSSNHNSYNEREKRETFENKAVEKNSSSTTEKTNQDGSLEAKRKVNQKPASVSVDTLSKSKPNIDGEEKQKLRDMLKEMKNSLPHAHRSKGAIKKVPKDARAVMEEVPPPPPQRSDSAVEAYLITTETVYENIKFRPQPLPPGTKVSSSAQTSSAIVRKVTPSKDLLLNSSSVEKAPYPPPSAPSLSTINKGEALIRDGILYTSLKRKVIGGGTFELIQAGDFASIEATKTGGSGGPVHLYANLPPPGRVRASGAVRLVQRSSEGIPPAGPFPSRQQEISSKNADQGSATAVKAETPLPPASSPSLPDNPKEVDEAKAEEDRLTAQLTLPKGLAKFKASLVPEEEGNLTDLEASGRLNPDTLAVARLLRRLEAAIAGGQHESAAILARQLARLKINCSVTRHANNRRSLMGSPRDSSVEGGPSSAASSTTGSTKITIDMYVEDKVSHLGPIPVVVSTSMTVGELKTRVEQDFEIPVNVQRWIIGRRLASDESLTLLQHDVTSNGTPVFLYLVAPGELEAASGNASAKDSKSSKASEKGEESDGSEQKKTEEENAPAVPEERMIAIQGDEMPRGRGWYYNFEEDRYSYCSETDSEAEEVEQPKDTAEVERHEVVPEKQAGVSGEPRRNVIIQNGVRLIVQEDEDEDDDFIDEVEEEEYEEEIVEEVEEEEYEEEVLEEVEEEAEEEEIEEEEEEEEEDDEEVAGAVGGALPVAAQQVVSPAKIPDPPPENKTGTLQLGWKCPLCTLVNPPTRPGCAACASERPANYRLPSNYKAGREEAERLNKEEKNQMAQEEAKKDEEDEKKRDYERLLHLEKSELVPNYDEFTCAVCFVDFEPNEGVTLRDCLHTFCRPCLVNTIQFSEEAEVKCPYRDDNYACDSTLQDREIRALVPADVYEQLLARSMALAEKKMGAQAFHCKTPDCQGWCVLEDNINIFPCPVCRHTNCLTCQAIHDGLNCKQYQEGLNKDSETNADAKRTKDMLEEMVTRGEAIVCPTCKVVLMKKWGCDWLRCSMCKTEICWVTRGPRWGPGGKGDITGGCKCGVNGVKCHPKCNYCH